jgi:hypothetical protein
LLNGCSKQNEKQKDTTAAETSATETTATETTQSDTETAQEETNSKEETQTNQEDANQGKSEMKKEATFVGQVDSNSMEVTIDNELTVLFLSESIKASFNLGDLKNGNKIEVTYYENDSSQLVVSVIIKLN